MQENPHLEKALVVYLAEKLVNSGLCIYHFYCVNKCNCE